LQSNFLDTDGPGHLLMPHRNAEQLRNAMQIANAQDMTASVSPTMPLHAPYAVDKAQDDDDQAQAPRRARTHVVRPGESLWQIARNYSTSVSTLERLNHLHGKALKPGQVLKLDSSGKH
jgi:membrane-bound lytic murein transglycosylase D